MAHGSPVKARQRRRARTPAVVVAVLVAAGLARGQTPDPPPARVAGIFASWTNATPGCAVGASLRGRVVFEAGYGTADLERETLITPNTIFEAGSVSKQFAAAAMLLLERDGKLSLDDQVRTYVPELPDYGAPLTIRQLLSHTSGLRDWGNVASIAGWPRGSRAYTHAHVLEIVSRQRALNFPSGTRWSYSNTNYNLAAIIVERVSREPFAEFTRKRLFEPLGMTSTSWRDDYTRVVKGRALAYTGAPGAFRTNMPFENAVGNGGLLTTVGDLLRWIRNLTEPKVGDARMWRDAQTSGRLVNGQEHGYGYGLFIAQYNGVREIHHGGTTGGYRAQLSWFPDQQFAVAVLCNVTTATADQYAHAVADAYLASSLRTPVPPRAAAVPAERLDAIAGLYKDVERGTAAPIDRDTEGLRVRNGPRLTPLSSTRFAVAGSDQVITFDGRGGARTSSAGTTQTFERVTPAQPIPAELEAFAGIYESDEAEVALTVVVRDGALEILRRPDTRIRLTPVYEDAFSAAVGTLTFTRDGSGRPAEFSVVQDRMWDLRFKRQ